MKQLIRTLKNNLDLSYREAKSALVFSIVTVLCLISYLVINHYTKKRKVQLSIKTYHNTQPILKPATTHYPKQKPEVNIKLTSFDPNTASQELLTTLGLPKYVINNILKYRSKGGTFKTKADFQKIYGLHPELYTKLEEWIALPSKTNKSEYSIRPQYTENTLPKATTHLPAVKPKNIDINIADTTQLISFRGIGSVYASRIVKFRDALGGFHDLSQLHETYGVKPEALSEVLLYAKIITPHSKIAINEVQTLKHPYLKAFQAKAIISYRNQHGAIETIDDLRKIKVLDEETLQKIMPYIRF